MKILIINTDTSINFNEFNNCVITYTKLKGIFGVPFRSWPKYILIDEKKFKVFSAGDLMKLMDYVGWIGNVLTVTSKQFMVHTKESILKAEYPNAVGPVPQFVQDMFARPLRKPCKHCKKEHADYPCNEQIEYIRLQLNRPLSEIKKICKGCNTPIILCTCTEHEKECVDCP